jgi:hypothetical protein
MRRLAVAGLLPALLIAACSGSGSHQKQTAPTTPPASGTPAPAPRITAVRKGDERVIRGWNKAVNAGDYGRAASFFAPGAVVIQDYALPLPTHRIATEWNSGLPCRADITAVQGQGPATVASFRLREGRTHLCVGGGDAQVLFTIRGGLIRIWRQLPNNGQSGAPAV